MTAGREIRGFSEDDSDYESTVVDQFTFETHPKEFIMTEGLQISSSETEHSSNPYLEIVANSISTSNGHVTNTRFTNGYHNPNVGRFYRSFSETQAGSPADRKTFSRCGLYIIGFMVAVSLLFAVTSIGLITVLWFKCADLETRLSSAQVSYTAGLAEPNVCLPCDDLVQGPFDEDNQQLKTLIQTMDKNTMTCCAKTSAQISTLLNLFVNRKQLSQCNLQLLNTSESTGSGCNKNATVAPGVPPSSNLRPAAHLQVDPKKKQIGGIGEHPIRHWTDSGKVSHLEGVKLIDDRLRIPETGTYFLYSQVGFLVYYDSGTTEQTIDLASQALFHKVYRYNPIYPNKGSQKLLRSEVTQCWEQHKAYGRYTSYVGAAIRLNRGDQIYVQVSRLSALSPEEAMTYFGLFKVDS